jgi:nitrogen fixation protein NifZ
MPGRLYRTGMSGVSDGSAARAPDEDFPEVYGTPRFMPGQKVRALVPIRNDGTVPGKSRGAFVVETGDVGYVTGIGEFLQRYYVYSVDFVARGRIVGMRGGEIEDMEE